MPARVALGDPVGRLLLLAVLKEETALALKASGRR
jgi:hypothetical protein